MTRKLTLGDFQKGGSLTLGDYRDLACQLGGEKSKAVKFFDDKIAKQGRDELVIADSSQMLALIGSLLGDTE